jgi:hypothetical protein
LAGVGEADGQVDRFDVARGEVDPPRLSTEGGVRGRRGAVFKVCVICPCTLERAAGGSAPG